MSRVAIDHNGRWFDSEKAEKFDDEKWFDGSNNVSLATRKANCFQTLYRTSGKVWIIHSYDYYQGSAEKYSIVDDSCAAAWLMVNEYDPDDLDFGVTIRKLMLALEV